jgi:cyanophycinase
MIQGGTTEAKTGPGLGLLPGVVVDQHFTQRKRIDRLRGVIAENPTSVGLGVDESTAAVVRGRSVKVIGEGTVTVVKANPAREDVLKAGGTAELPEPAAKK